MTNSKKRTIGLLVEDIFSDYTKEIIRSVHEAIPDNGSARLLVLAGRYDDGTCADANLRAFNTVYNSIYHLGEACDVDGLIVALGSLRTLGEGAAESGLMRRLRGVPKVFISADIPGCIQVRYDNESGIREAVELLTNVYGFSRLCMLGGREDNGDALERRDIFARCLCEKGLDFPPQAYVGTDMSENCKAEAARLLDANPDAQAVFCVNDAAAKGLYEAMRERGLRPGRDLLVFGFDNTRMSGEMDPPLASIGPTEQTIGAKAVQLLLACLDGKETTGEIVPTHLFTRASLSFNQFDFAPLTLQFMDDAGICRMFDECFYRYRSELYSRDRVDLRRLFLELAHRMQRAMSRRFMSHEEFKMVTKMIDIFVANGAFEFTDTERLMRGIDYVQTNINTVQRSAAANQAINRLFLHLKDCLIYAFAEQKAAEARRMLREQESLQNYLITGTDCSLDGVDRLDWLAENIGMLGLANAAFFLYDEPVTIGEDGNASYPENIRLRCVLKDGEAHIPSADRQNGPVKTSFAREELPSRCRGYLVFPVFCGRRVYGYLACAASGSVYDHGELVADQLGRVICLNEKNRKKH